MKNNVMILVFCLITAWAFQANASLTTIGTATYDGADYNLIWDDGDHDDNSHDHDSLVWLDYTNGGKWEMWASQNTWAESLASTGSLWTFDIDPEYSITWNDDTWRLPASFGSGTGYGITTSEMGHLFYTELGNSADNISPFNPVFGIFENLDSRNYWSDWAGLVQGDDTYYYFHMGGGSQFAQWYGSAIASGIAVRSGEVSVVPIPGAALLFGSSIIGILGIRRKLKK